MTLAIVACKRSLRVTNRIIANALSLAQGLTSNNTGHLTRSGLRCAHLVASRQGPRYYTSSTKTTQALSRLHKLTQDYTWQDSTQASGKANSGAGNLYQPCPVIKGIDDIMHLTFGGLSALLGTATEASCSFIFISDGVAIQSSVLQTRGDYNGSSTCLSTQQNSPVRSTSFIVQKGKAPGAKSYHLLGR
ncbi:hypothetical protein Pcinc_029699 [Petrolisthes cinctipes]|uniref:Uncharacterized protein n=1 Tax=Petrolisthes cinctipes TaxID=88211 RepID=A0AAE1F0B4_PETCI|nr:hypothetical protein Pcinc_029699 [Petrolisthes cinctipes]